MLRWGSILSASCLFVGAAIALLLNFDVVYKPFDFDPKASVISNLLGQADYLRDRWPLQLTGNLILAIGFLALIPVALALKERIGRSPGAQLFTTMFVVAGALGFSGRLFDIGAQDMLVANARPQAPATYVIGLFSAADIGDGPEQWLIAGFFLVAGFAFAALGWERMSRSVLPSGFLTYSKALAVGCFVAMVLRVFTEDPYVIVTGVLGMVGAPIWLAWLVRMDRSET